VEDKTRLIAPPPTSSSWLRRGLDILGKKVAHGMGVTLNKKKRLIILYYQLINYILSKRF
jgi:hypothetical protein